ncbi:MAG: Histone acetyltransferase HPA2-related acetyltransferase [Firmicutes bacterium]|nr:Histone acetyltransferase HPA2-related acetyltransferase [Bacillota bacterium]
MVFEYMKPGEEIKVANLIWRVFEEFEAPCYKQEGIDEFKTFISPENIKVNCGTGRFFFICCKDNDEIVGVISGRDNSHISLLFVEKAYQRMGIARNLFELAIKKCRETCPDLQAITVNSSLYAVGIYEKMGFERTDLEKEKNGIRFIPMKFLLILKDTV